MFMKRWCVEIIVMKQRFDFIMIVFLKQFGSNFPQIWPWSLSLICEKE